MNKTPEHSTAAAVRRQVLHSSDTAFTADDFAGTRQAVQRELSRLAARGELRPVRNGVYWRGRRTALGMTPPRAEDVVRKVVGEGVGPADWSAALELGVSTQHPNREFVASPRRVRGELPRVQIRERTGRERRRTEKLNRHEIAMLEVLENWNRVVDVPTHVAVKQLSSWLDSDRIRIGKLVRASETEPARVRENLRWLLDKAGHENEADQIRPASVPSTVGALVAA